MENRALEKLHRGQIQFGDSTFNPIKVSISQFYGIEINDFAVTVAKTALWIAESQMMKETENILHLNLDFLPLKSYTNIVEANALRIDWNKIIPNTECNYIMGNPPFIGYGLQSNEQKSDIKNIFLDIDNKQYSKAGKMDYVAGWYYKASEFIYNTRIRAAFVSTNSICQGEQVDSIWKILYQKFKIKIDFAYRTFRWDSEAKKKAQVFCIIIGFSFKDVITEKYLFDSNNMKIVNNINFYLIEAPNIFIASSNQPICDVPRMTTGNRPADGGNLILNNEEYESLIRKEPNAQKYIKKLTGAVEYINSIPRYCLWLVNADSSEIKKMPCIMDRINKCKEDRLKGAPDRIKLADTPMLFRETKNPDTFIIVPATSSDRRKYIPIGFLDKETIPTNAAVIIPDATIFHFGILESNVHMAWMRVVSGRLGTDYRYSKDIVYNNFPWPILNNKQKEKIEETAKEILEARAKYPNSSLADLYDELTMPPELRKAHQLNDIAVMEAYGFDWRKMTESECVAELMKMYKEIVDKK